MTTHTRPLPTLKLPDPRLVLERLAAGLPAGLLSRVERDERVGVEQLVVNERKGPEPGLFAWGTVTLRDGERVEGLADLEPAVLGGLDEVTRAEFAAERGFFYHPLALVDALPAPLPLKRAPPGRRFGATASIAELRKVSAEDLANAHVLLVDELRRRGLDHPARGDRLDALTAELGKAGSPTGAPGIPVERDLAPVGGSGVERGREVTLEEVLSHVRPFRVRQPFLYLVGGVVTRGRTRGDLDVLIRGPLDEATRHVVEFRLGRMFPPELSRRLSFLRDDDLGGPFTRNVPLADLTVEVYPRFEVKQMRDEDVPDPCSGVAKQGDPFLEYPEARGPRRGVLQLHFRGRSVHGDLRFDRGPNLVGWTLAWQRAGRVPDVDTLAGAREVARGLTAEGNRFLKPLLAPAKLQAFPKAAQPRVWLDVEGVIEPGKIGATTEEAGVFLVVDRPQVEWGCFEEGTLIPTFQGVKRIEDVVMGNALLGQDGQRVAVTAVFHRPFDGELIEVVPGHAPTFHCTPNHPVLMARPDEPSGNAYVRVSERALRPEWARADELREGDFLFVPRSRASGSITIPVQAGKVAPIAGELAWLLGLFVGDGCANEAACTVRFALSDEATIQRCVQALRALGHEALVRPGQGCQSIEVYDRPFARALAETFYAQDGRKRIPLELLDLASETLGSFVRGVFDADGSASRNVYEHEITQVTAGTIYPLHLMLAKLGVPARLRVYDKPNGTNYSPTPLRTYRVAWKSRALNFTDASPPVVEHSTAQVMEGFIATRVKRLARIPYRGPVYNLETEDHTICLPTVTHNSQLPFFHEYFLSGEILAGVLHVRRLEAGRLGGGRPEGEEELIWTAWLSKEALPSVLKRRAVEQKRMPPPGRSALPRSLERVVPREFRYWEERGEAARTTRDELVASRFLTERNVQVVDGEWRRVEEERTTKGWEGDPEAWVRQRSIPYVLHWQWWRGQVVVRGGVTRQLWRLVLDRGDRVEWWELDRDPATTARVTALHRTGRDRALLAAEGDQPPGSGLNPTRATPSGIEVLDRGEAQLLDDQRAFKKLRLSGGELRGLFTLQPEDPGDPESDLWIWSRGEVPQAKDAHETLGPGYAVLDAAEVGEGVRPLRVFQPMKPARKFKSVDELIAGWASPAFLKLGVAVEPKFNGRVVVASKRGDRTLIFFEDAKDDRSEVVPSVARELAAFPEDVVLVGEFMERDPSGGFVPRRELGRFSGGVQDDRHVRIQVFDVLYRGDRDLSWEPWEVRQEALREVLREKRTHFERVEPTVVHDADALRLAAREARRAPGSEGAMVKLVDSKYTLAGQTDSWSGWKSVRLVEALVLARVPVQGATDRWNYSAGVGPVSAEEAGRWADVAEVGGARYVRIGQTGNTQVRAEVGDVIEAEVLELLLDERDPAKRKLTWFGPAQVTGVLTGRVHPATVGAILALLQPGEVEERTSEARVLKRATDVEQRLVLGVVLVPEEPDTQGDIYSHDEVEFAQRWWMEHGHGAGLMHRQPLPDDRVRLLESYLAPVDFELGGERVKRGTWLAAHRIVDEALWTEVKAGRLTGYSIGGLAKILAEIRAKRVA